MPVFEALTYTLSYWFYGSLNKTVSLLGFGRFLKNFLPGVEKECVTRICSTLFALGSAGRFWRIASRCRPPSQVRDASCRLGWLARGNTFYHLSSLSRRGYTGLPSEDPNNEEDAVSLTKQRHAL